MRRTGFTWLAGASLAITVIMVVACGDSNDSEPNRAPTTPELGDVDRALLATAARIDAGADLRFVADSEYRALNEPTAVAEGDVVRTDASGFAEVVYFDGSLTRLDVDTEFTVVVLRDEPGGSEIRTEMGLGRTWHRVVELTGNSTYAVETAVATAVVRGTGFVVTCVDGPPIVCTFDVLEGSVEILLPSAAPVLLAAGESLTVRGDDTEPSRAETRLDGDPWIERNAGLDLDDGFGPLVPTGAPPPREGGDDEVAQPALPDDGCDLFSTAQVEAAMGATQPMSTAPWAGSAGCEYRYEVEGSVGDAPDDLYIAEVVVQVTDQQTTDAALTFPERSLELQGGAPFADLGDRAAIARPDVANPSDRYLFLSMACGRRTVFFQSRVEVFLPDARTTMDFMQAGDPLALAPADVPAVEAGTVELARSFIESWC